MNERTTKVGHSRTVGPAVIAAAAVAATLAASCGGGLATTTQPPVAAAKTVTVTRQDLTARDEYPGWLGFGNGVPLVAAREGVVTWMPEQGDVVARGGVVAEINGAATNLLLGDRPAWRRLSTDEHDGPDIRQLNDNLAALGYAPRSELPGAEFDWRTREAVEDWQEARGMRRTGAVELGDVAFLPSEVRVTTVESPVGTWVAAGQILANATSTMQLVTVDLDAARQGSLAEGSSVVVVLPDGTSVDATVRSVGRAVSAPQETAGAPTVRVEITTTMLIEHLDTAPVVVAVERVIAEGVLTVPVAALVARTGGGYAVELVTATGTEYVAVEPGRFASGLVAITGDVAEGDPVVVPS